MNYDMTVKEFVAELQKYPADAQVAMIAENEDGITEVPPKLSYEENDAFGAGEPHTVYIQPPADFLTGETAY